MYDIFFVTSKLNGFLSLCCLLKSGRGKKKRKKKRRGNPLSFPIGRSGNRLIWLADPCSPEKPKINKNKNLNRTAKFPLSEGTRELQCARACSASFVSVSVFFRVAGFRSFAFVSVCSFQLAASRFSLREREREREGTMDGAQALLNAQ
jgi:hypothetical protein